MINKRVLYISQEIFPYTGDTNMGEIASLLPQKIQEEGNDIRMFLPKFGSINERKHQLHEVIRLSGMNLIIDDFDHQLIIKVASIQKLRMQVYFIDNDEYFPRKQMLHELDGTFMKNNDERMIFYCKGVIETVRKLGWKPDIIHCQGWFSSLVPMYIKKLYNEDPLFEDVKVIYSVFNNAFKGIVSKTLPDKLLFEDLEESDVACLKTATINTLHRFAIDHADAVVQANANVDPKLLSYIKESGKSFMQYPGAEDYIEAYQDFYEQFVEEEVALMEN